MEAFELVRTKLGRDAAGKLGGDRAFISPRRRWICSTFIFFFFFVRADFFLAARHPQAGGLRRGGSAETRGVQGPGVPCAPVLILRPSYCRASPAFLAFLPGARHRPLGR